MKKLSILLITALFFSFTVSCGGEEDDSSETGSITLNVKDGGVARTIVPDFDMEIDSFDIHGDGPGSRTFDVTSNLENVQIPKLHFGPWTVMVNAKNAAGDIIATGAGSVVVHTAQATPLSITVRPLVGSGSLDLTVNWPAADTETPVIDSTLISTDSSSQSLSFTVNGSGDQAHHTSSQDTGYHTLILKLLDNGQLTFGHVEVVRIIKDKTTEGVFNFDRINAGNGSLDIEIDPEMAEPIDVTLGGNEAEVAVGGNMTVQGPKWSLGI